MSKTVLITSIVIFLCYFHSTTCFPVTEVPNPDFNSFDLPDTVEELDPGTVVDLFIQFEHVYNKEYRSPLDQAKSRAYFQQNLINIIQLNQKYSNQSLRFGVNYYTDFSDLEFAEKVANLHPDSAPEQGNGNETVRFEEEELPTFFDWTTRKLTIGSVGNQGYCGCSWAYTISSLLQSAYSIGRIQYVNPSEQQLCDCAQGGNSGCLGGSVLDGLDYLKHNGVVKAANYQVDEEVDDFCRPDRETLHLSSYSFVSPPNALQIQRSIVGKGPVGVGFKVSNSFRHYKSGVFSLSDCDEEDHFLGWHTVTVVGYGRDGNGHEFWIAKNSWSPSFGESGFFRFSRNRDLCEIESKMPVYVEI